MRYSGYDKLGKGIASYNVSAENKLRMEVLAIQNLPWLN